ncbi:ribosome biogenesis GTPase Der [Buchnera aphidicola]|uniref:ribosome biogenesis GTPase Der n=1 Tax=Buchnera aphidicola TaxID=9 RepID=UPI00094C8264|nr:ribosome biogenesis GTPase Der [Buchnera aphidicola]
MTPIIALIGRTNVGKSSFFNLLTKSNVALVNSKPGTTRDRNRNHFYINKKKFILIDTAGISISYDSKGSQKNFLYSKMYTQTILAIKEANFIFFMVDIKMGITHAEHFILRKIRLENKKIFLLINKIDALKKINNCIDFYDLGINEIYKISISHRIGILYFLKKFYKFYKKIMISDQDKSLEKKENSDFFKKKIKRKDSIDIKICIIGKTNVGKSSLINRILKDNRMIVHHQEHTTRGISYSFCNHYNNNYTLIDTGGLRRKTKKNNLLEHLSMLKVMQEIEKSHITIIVLDASCSICSQDLYILSLVYKTGKSFYIIVNKWDLIEKKRYKEVKRNIFQRLSFIKNYKILFVSSLLNKGLENFFKVSNLIYLQSMKNFSASYLTKIVTLAIKKHPIPMGVKGKAIRLKYAHLGGRNPFLIVIHGTKTQFLSPSYKKYLINFLQKTLQIPSTPIRLFFKNSYNPYDKKK